MLLSSCETETGSIEFRSHKNSNSTIHFCFLFPVVNEVVTIIRNNLVVLLDFFIWYFIYCSSPPPKLGNFFLCFLADYVVFYRIFICRECRKRILTNCRLISARISAFSNFNFSHTSNCSSLCFFRITNVSKSGCICRYSDSKAKFVILSSSISFSCSTTSSFSAIHMKNPQNFNKLIVSHTEARKSSRGLFVVCCKSLKWRVFFCYSFLFFLTYFYFLVLNCFLVYFFSSLVIYDHWPAST